MDSTAAEIKQFILREFLPGEDPDNLTESTPLIAGGVLDSIASLKLAAHLEDKFGATLQPHEINEENLGSITAIVRFVASKQEQ